MLAQCMLDQTYDYNFLGSLAFFSMQKIAYLCSRHISPLSVLRSYDWATTMRDEGKCVISGYHSQIERDVLHFLAKGTSPLIVVLGRGLYQKYPAHLQAIIRSHLPIGKLLIISPFPASQTKTTEHSCLQRNSLILSLADEIVVGYADPKGSLVKLLKQAEKPVSYLS